MSMEINTAASGVTTQQAGYASASKTNNSKSPADLGSVNKQGTATTWSSEAATYEKGSTQPSATYSIKKMSKDDV